MIPCFLGSYFLLLISIDLSLFQSKSGGECAVLSVGYYYGILLPFFVHFVYCMNT